MLKTPILRVATYLGLLLLLSCESVVAGRLHEFRAEPLRLESNRLYLWLDAPIIPTSDFTLAIAQGDRLLYRGRVGGILERVVISQVLPADVVADLNNFEDFCCRSLFGI